MGDVSRTEPQLEDALIGGQVWCIIRAMLDGNDTSKPGAEQGMPHVGLH